MAYLLQQRQELIHCELCGANQRSQSSYRKFFMLGNGKICSNTGLAHHYVAADLPHHLPARLAERLYSFVA